MTTAGKQTRGAARDAAGSPQDEAIALEARRQQLLELVGELLKTNEELRQKVARLEEQQILSL